MGGKERQKKNRHDKWCHEKEKKKKGGKNKMKDKIREFIIAHFFALWNDKIKR